MIISMPIKIILRLNSFVENIRMRINEWILGMGDRGQGQGGLRGAERTSRGLVGVEGASRGLVGVENVGLGVNRVERRWAKRSIAILG